MPGLQEAQNKSKKKTISFVRRTTGHNLRQGPRLLPQRAASSRLVSFKRSYTPKARDTESSNIVELPTAVPSEVLSSTSGVAPEKIILRILSKESVQLIKDDDTLHVISSKVIKKRAPALSTMDSDEEGSIHADEIDAVAARLLGPDSDASWPLANRRRAMVAVDPTPRSKRRKGRDAPLGGTQGKERPISLPLRLHGPAGAALGDGNSECHIRVSPASLQGPVAAAPRVGLAYWPAPAPGGRARSWIGRLPPSQSAPDGDGWHRGLGDPGSHGGHGGHGLVTGYGWVGGPLPEGSQVPLGVHGGCGGYGGYGGFAVIGDSGAQVAAVESDRGYVCDPRDAGGCRGGGPSRRPHAAAEPDRRYGAGGRAAAGVAGVAGDGAGASPLKPGGGVYSAGAGGFDDADSWGPEAASGSADGAAAREVDARSGGEWDCVRGVGGVALDDAGVIEVGSEGGSCQPSPESGAAAAAAAGDGPGADVLDLLDLLCYPLDLGDPALQPPPAPASRCMDLDSDLGLGSTRIAPASRCMAASLTEPLAGLTVTEPPAAEKEPPAAVTEPCVMAPPAAATSIASTDSGLVCAWAGGAALPAAQEEALGTGAGAGPPLRGSQEASRARGGADGACFPGEGHDDGDGEAGSGNGVDRGRGGAAAVPVWATMLEDAAGGTACCGMWDLESLEIDSDSWCFK